MDLHMLNSRMKPLIRKMFSAVVILMLVGCEQNDSPSYRPQFSDAPLQTQAQYIFGIHPMHNPQRLHEVFEPLIAYLNNNIPNVQFKLEASRNYAAFDEKLYSKRFDFALPNPYQTINAIDVGYRVFGKMGDDDNFRGIVLVRKDSGIEKPSDLIGKAVSYPALTALAATMMPQYYLQTHGVNVMDELDNRYVGSQESSIMNVYLGDTMAGSTWPPSWQALSAERPELANELKVIWQTESLPNNGLVVLPSVPESTILNVQQLLVALHESEEGRLILERIVLSQFESATDETYRPVRDFVAIFSQVVRPLKED